MIRTLDSRTSSLGHHTRGKFGLLSSMAAKKDDPITVAEVERLAKQKLPESVYNYYACGADDEFVLRKNVDIFSSLVISPLWPRPERLTDSEQHKPFATSPS